MQYRQMGHTGLQVSVVSLGTATLYKLEKKEREQIFGRAFDLGINYLDTAEAYMSGSAEDATGEIIRNLGIKREKLVLATKCFSYSWSDPDAGPNELNTLNRKYIRHAIDRSLRRLGVDYVDIYYCHQFDATTPISETVHAMSNIIDEGKVLYWATSNWTAEQIEEACNFADRYGFHRPICEQAEYSLLYRNNVDNILRERLESLGVGIAAWGPLAGGVLTGKYASSALPEDSRATEEWLKEDGTSGLLTDDRRNAIVRSLMEIAADISTDVTRLSLAWCLCNPVCATVVTAASKLSQLENSVGCIETLTAFTPQILDRIDAAIGDYDMSYVPKHRAETAN